MRFLRILLLAVVCGTGIICLVLILTSTRPEPVTATIIETEAETTEPHTKVSTVRKEYEQVEFVHNFEGGCLQIPHYYGWEWETGSASAYGGKSDAQIDNNKITATEDIIEENSTGVAIPKAWGNVKDYYGKTIYIKYGDIVIKGIINDCGYMDNGNRSLDLQPGIFHHFGFDTCDDWGVREVEYKIVEE